MSVTQNVFANSRKTKTEPHTGPLSIYIRGFIKLRQVKFASFLQQGAGSFTVLFSSKFPQNGVT